MADIKKLSVLLGSVILCLLVACAGPQSPEFERIENVKFKSLSFTNGLSVTLQGDAIFHNPNPIGAKVTEIDLDVYINDKKVTHIRQEVSSTMKANADFSLPLNFDIPLKEVTKDLKPTLGNIFKKMEVEYKLDGNIKVGLGNVELRVPVEHKGKEALK